LEKVIGIYTNIPAGNGKNEKTTQVVEKSLPTFTKEKEPLRYRLQ
jgi:hypothetical protein